MSHRWHSTRNRGASELPSIRSLGINIADSQPDDHKNLKNSLSFVFRNMMANKRADARFPMGCSCAKNMLPPIILHHLHHVLVLLGIFAS
jgi:hypothetical protein